MRNGLPFSKPRVRLYGDQAQAQKHLGDANLLMYQVRLFCDSAKVPVYSLRREFPDGTVIEAAQFGAQEIVTVWGKGFNGGRCGTRRGGFVCSPSGQQQTMFWRSGAGYAVERVVAGKQYGNTGWHGSRPQDVLTWDAGDRGPESGSSTYSSGFLSAPTGYDLYYNGAALFSTVSEAAAETSYYAYKVAGAAFRGSKLRVIVTEYEGDSVALVLLEIPCPEICVEGVLLRQITGGATVVATWTTSSLTPVPYSYDPTPDLMSSCKFDPSGNKAVALFIGKYRQAVVELVGSSFNVLLERIHEVDVVPPTMWNTMAWSHTVSQYRYEALPSSEPTTLYVDYVHSWTDKAKNKGELYWGADYDANGDLILGKQVCVSWEGSGDGEYHFQCPLGTDAYYGTLDPADVTVSESVVSTATGKHAIQFVDRNGSVLSSIDVWDTEARANWSYTGGEPFSFTNNGTYVEIKRLVYSVIAADCRTQTFGAVFTDRRRDFASSADWPFGSTIAMNYIVSNAYPLLQQWDESSYIEMYVKGEIVAGPITVAEGEGDDGYSPQAHHLRLKPVGAFNGPSSFSEGVETGEIDDAPSHISFAWYRQTISVASTTQQQFSPDHIAGWAEYMGDVAATATLDAGHGYYQREAWMRGGDFMPQDSDSENVSYTAHPASLGYLSHAGLFAVVGASSAGVTNLSIV